MGKYDKLRGLVPSYKEALSELKKQYADFDDTDLLQKFSELKSQKQTLDLRTQLLEKDLAAVTELLIEKMEAKNLTQLKNSKLGTFSLRTNVYVTQKDKERLFTWLRENDYGDVIKEQVNPKVLNSLFADILSNSSLPDDAGVDVFLKHNITNIPIKN